MVKVLKGRKLHYARPEVLYKVKQKLNSTTGSLNGYKMQC